MIDGDSLNYGGEQIRIADIDAPELGSPECDKEYALGLRAKDRLLELLNSGSFKLVPIDRRLDGYGRALYIITREGHSLGDQMVGEGLAHEWRGHREGWCDS